MTKQQADPCPNELCARPRNDRLSDTHCCAICAASEGQSTSGELHAAACRHPELDDRIVRYRPPSNADPDHTETYETAVNEVRQWITGPDAVPRLRALYAQSWQDQKNGALRQPTYRRALVHVVAAWLSMGASCEAGDKDVTVSPQSARRVLESAASGLQLEPAAVIWHAVAMARRGGRDELGDNE